MKKFFIAVIIVFTALLGCRSGMSTKIFLESGEFSAEGKARSADTIFLRQYGRTKVDLAEEKNNLSLTKNFNKCMELAQTAPISEIEMRAKICREYLYMKAEKLPYELYEKERIKKRKKVISILNPGRCRLKNVIVNGVNIGEIGPRKKRKAALDWPQGTKVAVEVERYNEFYLGKFEAELVVNNAREIRLGGACGQGLSAGEWR